MMARRPVLAVFTALVLAAAVVPAAAAPRGHSAPRVTITAEGPCTLISLRYGSGAGEHVRFVHAHTAIERVAVTDIDNDGDFDVVAARRDGALMLWRNAGHGRFALAVLPRDTHRLTTHGPRLSTREHPDEGWQWGDDGHDAAMPRAPDVIADLPAAPVRLAASAYARRAAFRRFSDRAPPVL